MLWALHFALVARPVWAAEWSDWQNAGGGFYWRHKQEGTGFKS